MKANDLMTHPPVTCRLDDSVASAAMSMKLNNIGFLPVTDSLGMLVGVVTDRDLALRVLAESWPADTCVSEAMTSHVVKCAPGDDFSTILEKMTDARKSRIAVVAHERCVGVISLADIAVGGGDSRKGWRALAAISTREVSPEL